MHRTEFRLSRWTLAAAVAAVAPFVPFPARAADPAPPFVLPAQGCPMAHCDPQMTDRDPLPAPPAGQAVALWHDASVRGSAVGLGCASNGSVVACSLAASGADGAGRHLAVYDATGNRLGGADGFAGLGPTAFASAPMVSEDGSVVAADADHLFRFDPDGQVRWSVALSGALPISPILVGSDTLLLATKPASGSSFAPVSAYALEDGAVLGQLPLTSPEGDFGTVNTAAAFGRRVYVVSELLAADGTPAPDHLGRLFAIDVGDAAGPGPALRVAWSFDFRGPSGASPLVVPDEQGRPRIYFDGEGTAGATTDTPLFFGVVDEGSAPRLLWTQALAAGAQASAALDPRGGFWVFGAGDSKLLRLDEGDGGVLQTVDLQDLGRGLYPTSAMSIAGPDTAPVMLVAATSKERLLAGKSLLVAVDLVGGRERWRFSTGARSLGQFPVMRTAAGQAVVVTSTAGGGVYGIVAGH